MKTKHKETHKETHKAIPESHHWYFRNGDPCWKVPLSKPKKLEDGTVQTHTENIRVNLHMEKHDLFLSTTSIIKREGPLSFGIQNWTMDLMYGAATDILYEELKKSIIADRGIDADLLKTQVYEEFRKRSNVASDRGNELHALCGSYFESDASLIDTGDEDADVIINGTCDLLAKIGATGGMNGVYVERPFASELGYAGRCDLIAQTPNGSVLLDWKTMSNPSSFEACVKKPYDEHAMQIAGYRNGLNSQTTESVSVQKEIRLIGDCYELYYCTATKEFVAHKWSEHVLAVQQRIFMRLVDNFKDRWGVE